jgi:hypothetical protein
MKKIVFSIATFLLNAARIRLFADRVVWFCCFPIHSACMRKTLSF